MTDYYTPKAVAFVRRVAGGAIALAAAGLCMGSPAAAHDFWIQPGDWCPSIATRAPYTLQVGHGEDRQRSAIRAARVTRFDVIGPDGAVTDIRGHMSLGEEVADGAFVPSTDGTQILAFETDHRGESHLPADQYTAYLLDEGLTPALAWRDHAARTDTAGSETYGRVAKALVWRGTTPYPSQDAALRPVGLSLEIVPEINPYRGDRPTRLPVRVYWKGQPLAGALVKLTDLADDSRPRDSQLTDSEGRARFEVPLTGNWLLNVVWTELLPPDRETEFETTFSSLTFGCRA
jgi:uncharacterized GH25 family protein